MQTTSDTKLKHDQFKHQFKIDFKTIYFYLFYLVAVGFVLF